MQTLQDLDSNDKHQMMSCLQLGVSEMLQTGTEPLALNMSIDKDNNSRTRYGAVFSTH